MLCLNEHICEPCEEGAHECADLFVSPTCGVVACDCDACHTEFNRVFWEKT